MYLVSRPELEECSHALNSSDVEVRSGEIPEEIIHSRREYGIPLDCTWVITAPPLQRIYLQFFDYLLEKPNDCTYNFVEVYGSRTELHGSEGRLKQFCGSQTDTVTSPGNVLHIRFYTHYNYDESKILSEFIAYYNFYRELGEGDF